MIYLELFATFFQIGLFSIGGGYAALPLIEQLVITDKAWLTLAEFADLLAISQITPGPIALNAATFIGTRVAGIPGAIIATVGNITPSCIIVLTLAYFYQKYRSMGVIQGVLEGLKPAVVSLIASAGISVIALVLWGDAPTYRPGDISIGAAILFLAGLVVLRKWKLTPIKLMLASGVLAMGISLVFGVTV
jgi:chromate transporter